MTIYRRILAVVDLSQDSAEVAGRARAIARHLLFIYHPEPEKSSPRSEFFRWLYNH